MVHKEWERKQEFRKMRSLDIWKEGSALLGSATHKHEGKSGSALKPFQQ